MTATTSVSIPGLRPRATGKVREIFDLGDTLLMVATDRISAFDVVLRSGIPYKGHVLNQLSRFWFDLLRPPHHMLTTSWPAIERAVHEAGGEPVPELAGRSMLVQKAEPVRLECVVRGYISGSLWKEYREAGGPGQSVVIHGTSLPAGLQESAKLPEPIFTPATKAETGHDENISMEQARSLVGSDLAEDLRRRSLTLYEQAWEYAERAGLILADTKFEFGIFGGEPIVIDEILTPDSSRFWDARSYEPGGPQPSFDKQAVRDYLEQTGWDKRPPAPELPPDVVEATSRRYVEAFRRLTGRELEYVEA